MAEEETKTCGTVTEEKEEEVAEEVAE